MSVLNANSAYPDQMPRSVASDLGLHCLPMPLLCTRLKWVNIYMHMVHANHVMTFVHSVV